MPQSYCWQVSERGPGPWFSGQQSLWEHLQTFFPVRWHTSQPASHEHRRQNVWFLGEFLPTCLWRFVLLPYMLLKLLGKSLLVSGGRTALSLPVRALKGYMPHMCAGGSAASLCLDSAPSGGGVRSGGISEQRTSPYRPTPP